MTSPAPREPLAPTESVRAVFELLDADPKLEGKGLSEAFARSFPEPPAEVEALAATEAARMAVILGVPGIAIMDVVQSVATAPEKVKMLVGLVGARLVPSFQTCSTDQERRRYVPAGRGECHGRAGMQGSVTGGREHAP